MKSYDGGPVEQGNWGVRYARRKNGSIEAKEWLEAQSEKVQSSFAHLFRRIAATGKIFNEQQFRNLGDGIWEFKRGGHRILCFQHEKTWWLTHHYPKKSQKCPKNEIEKAKTIRNEFFELLAMEVERNE